MNKINDKILRSGTRICFVMLILFAVASIFFNIYVATVEIVVTIALYVYVYGKQKSQRRKVLDYIQNVNFNVNSTTNDTIINSPLPTVIIKLDSGEVVWSNERFLKAAEEREHIFEIRITDIVPGFSTGWLLEGQEKSPEEISLKGRKYAVYGSIVRSDPNGPSRGIFAITYWLDITESSKAYDEYLNTRPVICIILLDNYDEILGNNPENLKTQILADIDDKISEWAEPADGILSKYDRDRYVLLLEERWYLKLKEGKFSLLDSVSEIVGPGGIPATVSIGVGKGGANYKENYGFAVLSIEMALSRGGNQVVVKNGANFEFYGGRAKEADRHTKVKSRVMANALGVLIGEASAVFVMSHKMADIDSIGSAVGICCIARKRGKRACIVLGKTESPSDGLIEKIMALPEYSGTFVTAQQAHEMLDSKSLLVVVDTNRPEQVESEELLSAFGRVAVIDHHRRAATYIVKAALNFHEAYASSTCELVTELMPYLLEPADILRAEAEALLAGIVLDTKNFTLRAGERTFDAAAFLRRAGADTTEVKKLFQSDLGQTVARYEVIRSAGLYQDNIAIAVVDKVIDRVVAAQAADELLNISGIEASFVIYRENSNVAISARSIGEINVQVILEKLGGGGNKATAGTQIISEDIDKVLEDLMRTIDQYLANEG